MLVCTLILPIILSRKKATSLLLMKPLLHSSTAMSRSWSNDTIVRIGTNKPPESWKLGSFMSSIKVLVPFTVKYQCVATGVPWKLTLQVMETLDAFAGAGSTTVPPFSTNGSVDNPVTWSLSIGVGTGGAPGARAPPLKNSKPSVPPPWDAN